MPIMKALCSEQAPSIAWTLCSLLTKLRSPCTAGVWGTHLAAPTSEGVVRPLSNVMFIPMYAASGSRKLQDCLDAWGTSVGRPCVVTASETLFLQLEPLCVRVQGEADVDELDSQFTVRMGETLWMPGVTDATGQIVYQYEIRSLIIEQSIASDQLAFRSAHWDADKTTVPTAVQCTLRAPKSLILALRLVGQVPEQAD